MKYLTAIYSAIIWGSGQFLNRQKTKAFILFALQIIFISIELLSWQAWRSAARLTAYRMELAELTGNFNLGIFLQAMGEQLGVIHNYGFFIRGLWGLVTLGTIPRTPGAVIFDHSIMLMLGGIIAVVVLLLFGAIWIWNIRDAYKTRIQLDNGVYVSSALYFRNLWKNSFEYIMVAPGALLVIFISLVPIVFSILVAFTNYNANNIPPRRLIEWTGFETFQNIFAIRIWGSTFVRIFLWTVTWAFLATFSAYAFGMLQALILRSKVVVFRSFWRAIFILPWAVPGIVSILVFRVMLNHEGAFNQMLLQAGIINQAIPFLSNVFWARLSLILVNVWLGFPFFMILISGVMTTIPQEQYEAAQIDGANIFQQFRSITLPFILTATAPQILMSITFNFNNFNLIYFLTGGGPPSPDLQMAGSTDILISWIFRLTLNHRMYNYAAAFSIMIFIVIATVSAWNLLRTRAFKEK